jgi:hypothetical protein
VHTRIERKEPFFGANQVDSGVDVHGDRIHREALGLAGVDDRRGLIEDVGREIFVGEDNRARGGDAQRPESDLGEEGSAIELRWEVSFVIECFVGHVLPLQRAPASGGLERNGRSMDSTEIKPVGSAETRLYDSMVMVPAGQRAAHKSATDAARLIFQHGRAGDDAKLVCLDVVQFHAEQFADLRELPVVASSKAMRSSETSSRQFSGQTSTQPPHKNAGGARPRHCLQRRC